MSEFRMYLFKGSPRHMDTLKIISILSKSFVPIDLNISVKPNFKFKSAKLIFNKT